MQKEWAAKDAALAKQLEELVEQVESGQAPPEAAAMLNNLLGGLLGSPPASKAPTMAPSPVTKPRSPSKPTLRGVAPVMPPPQQQQQPSSPSARMQQQPLPSSRQHDQQQQQQQSPTSSPTARTQTARRVAMKLVEADEEHIATGAEGGLAEAEAALDEIVERSLQQAALWDEVKNRLKSSALGMSGGQQQRLCIARAVAVDPEVILMDEPCSALDPIATARVEDLMLELKSEYTIIIVTHNMQQAARVSDVTAFFSTEVNPDGDLRTGCLVEMNQTNAIFSNPAEERTEQYITGRFG